RDELDGQRKRAVARAMGPGLDGSGEIDLEAVSVSDGGWDDIDDDLDWDAEPPAGEQPEPDQPDQANAEPETHEDFDIDVFLAEQRTQLVEQSGLDADEIDIIWPHENEHGEIEWQARVGRPYTNPDGTVRTVQANLSRPATDIRFAQEVVSRVERRAAEPRDPRGGSDTRPAVL